MRSRIALTFMIVVGLLMGTTGATLAVSGSSSDDNAAEGQYREVDEDDRDTGFVLGVQEEDDSDEVEVLPSGDGNPPPPEETEQVVAASDDELPVTGFVTIPLMIGGVALLSAGAVLRWRVRDRE